MGTGIKKIRGESLNFIRLPTNQDHLAYVVFLSKDSSVTRLGGRT